MTLKKSHLETLFLALKGTEGILSLAESRKRDAFLKEVSKNLETFFIDRKTIFEKFCSKKEDGTPDIVDDKYSFPREVQEELNKELLILAGEKVDIPTPENLKEMLEKSEYKPKIGEADLIDEIISKLEPKKLKKAS